jgi:hypothetical protein
MANNGAARVVENACSPRRAKHTCTELSTFPTRPVSYDTESGDPGGGCSETSTRPRPFPSCGAMGNEVHRQRLGLPYSRPPMNQLNPARAL